MDNFWESQLFASLSELLGVVNDRGLTADQFKVVAEPSHSGSALFHLISLTSAEPDPLFAVVSVGAEDPADLIVAEERFEAVDEAESIIRDSQHD